MSDDSKDYYAERLRHVMTALDTFRTVISGSENKSWARSAYDNLLRELQAFQATEETKMLEEYRGLLRDVLSQLDEGAAHVAVIGDRIRDVLGILPVPPELPPE